MAERRMFSKKIVDTDIFLEMPVSARLLYYDLAMRADDDGFIASPKKITQMIGCSEDDLKLLVAKRFIISFESGICVVKAWRMHNYIQKDRYHKTQFSKELQTLKVSENGTYERLDTSCIQAVSNLDTEVSLGLESGEVSLGLELGEVSCEGEFLPPPHTPSAPKIKAVKTKYGEFNNVLLTEDEFSKLSEQLGVSRLEDYIMRLGGYVASTGKSYKNHYATILNWFRKDDEKKTADKPTSYDIDEIDKHWDTVPKLV